jgi:hypothetical protein
MAWAPDYVTTDELREYIAGDNDDPVDDVYLALGKSAASRAIDHACNRQFGNVPAELRIYEARPDYTTGYWCVDVDDFQSAAGLVVTVDGTAITAFDKAPLNAAPMGRPWTRIEFTADSEAYPTLPPHRVDVVAPWGWAAVHDTIKQATLLQGSRFATRRQAPFGVAGSPESGSEMRLLSKVDADVAVMIRDFRRIRAPQ